MSNKKKKPENFLRRLLNDEGEFAYYTHEQLFGDEPPKIGVVIKTRTAEGFTREQREQLADGLRQTKAKHLLINLVYEENESEIPFLCQMITAIFYRKMHNLKREEAQPTLVFQKEPPAELLRDLRYAVTSRPGVYHSSLPFFSDLVVIVLSELSNALHNANLKIFARSQKARRDAYNVQLKQNFPDTPPPLRMALAQLAALTEEEMDGANIELQEGILETMQGKSAQDNKEPFADITPEQIVQEVETFLREHR